MSGKILIAYRRPGETRAGLVQNGRVMDLRVERDSGAAPGTIYRGRVMRLDPEIKAAFVDIGEDRPGFLPFNKLRRDTNPHEGEALIVQLVAAGAGEKGPMLTGDIALQGRYAVLTPRSADIVVSKKIGDPKRRQALRTLLSENLAAGCGAIARTAAAGAEAERISGDLRRLIQLWGEIEAVQGQRLWMPPPEWHVLADEAVLFRGYHLTPPPGLPSAPPEPDDRDLLDEAVEEASARRVPVEGGNLVIERTEALWAIDINGSATAGRLAAAAVAELPRQIRLRGLSGIILADLPKLPRTDLKPMIDGLAVAFADDPVPTQVHGVSRAGLLEVTRARLRPPLAEITGQDPTETRTLNILWQAVWEALAAKRGKASLPAGTAVAPALVKEVWDLYGVAVETVDGD